jgi:hypothetical protein
LLIISVKKRAGKKPGFPQTVAAIWGKPTHEQEAIAESSAC